MTCVYISIRLKLSKRASGDNAPGLSSKASLFFYGIMNRVVFVTHLLAHKRTHISPLHGNCDFKWSHGFSAKKCVFMCINVCVVVISFMNISCSCYSKLCVLIQDLTGLLASVRQGAM